MFKKIVRIILVVVAIPIAWISAAWLSQFTGPEWLPGLLYLLALRTFEGGVAALSLVYKYYWAIIVVMFAAITFHSLQRKNG